MTRFDEPPSYLDQYQAEYEESQRQTSGLAISSLVCSLIICCPGLPLIGIVLGLAAIVQIGGTPRLKGQGLALAGIIIGLIITLGQAAATWQLATAYQMFRDAPYTALEPGFRGDFAAMRDNFGPAGQAATDEQAREFIEQLRERYGELQESRLDFEAMAAMQRPDPAQREITMPWVLVFDRASVEVEFTYRPEDQVERRRVIFHHVRVLDPQLPDLEFPPPEAIEAAEREAVQEAPVQEDPDDVDVDEDS